MMTVLAYALVLFLGQYGPLLGMIASTPLGFILMSAPARLRVIVGGIFAGIVGALITVGFAFFVFNRIVGRGAFGVLPFVAAALSLVMPIRNDFRKYRELRIIQNGMSPGLGSAVESDVLIHGIAPTGNVVGLAVAALWFLTRP